MLRKRIFVRNSVILAGLSLATACAQVPTGSDAPPQATAAVFKTLFADNASAQRGNAAAFCVGTGSGAELADPSPALLAALRDVAKVRPASDCIVQEVGSRVVLKESGRDALLFGVTSNGCSSATECSFSGSYFEGNLSSQTNQYTARNVNGAWRIELATLGPVAFTASPAS